MANLKIVCTDQVPVTEPTTHAHIVSVGVDTNLDGWADEKHSKQTVIDNITSDKHIYYTEGINSKKVALVEVAKCRHCGRLIIRSAPDAVKDNNLDYLRRCVWR